MRTLTTGTSKGRHRLGAQGLVHCARHRRVFLALKAQRRSRLSALLTPAKHSLSGLRRKAVAAAREGSWAPAVTSA
jgi:hypothetical protein